MRILKPKKFKEFKAIYIVLLFSLIQLSAIGAQSQIVNVNDLKGNLPILRDNKLDVTQQNHTDLIGYIAVSPDGSMVASASVDKTIKIWDVNSDNVIRTINLPSNYTTDTIHSIYYTTSDPYTQHSLLFSNDGTKLLISLQRNDTSTIDLVQFDVNNGTQLNSFPIASKFLFNALENDSVLVRTTYGALSYNLTTGNYTSVSLQLSFGASPNFILVTDNSSPQPNSLIYDEYSQCPGISTCNRGTIHIGQNITISGAHQSFIYSGALNQNQTILTTIDNYNIKFWDLSDCSSTNCTLIRSLPISMIRNGIQDVQKVSLSVSADNSAMLLSVITADNQIGSISTYNFTLNKYGSRFTGFSGLFLPNRKEFTYFDNASLLFYTVDSSLFPSTTNGQASISQTTNSVYSSNTTSINPSATFNEDFMLLAFFSLIFIKKRNNSKK